MPAPHRPASPLPATEPRRFRVEELSARTGAPVRTIREYQTWQILPPPTRDGRIGWYDDTHVRRLEGIARLQERGYSIAAIRDLFDAWEQGAGLGDVLDADDAVATPIDEAPIRLTAGQLGALLPAVASSKRLLARAIRIRLLQRDGDVFVARSPSLLQLVADVIGTGVSPTAALDLAEGIVDAADAAGRAVAATIALGAASGADAVAPLVRRGRALLGRAIASHTVDEVARHLRTDDPALAELLASVRIGTVVTPAAPAIPEAPRRD